ncbi:MAG: ATP-binding protein [Oscillatoria princeps RMCB-10]|jgi:hypothetical protein|nr:ATP-binding protein [Oscillatoria princeps RMCB-10]
MARDSVSSIKALNDAIASHNPFDRLRAVRDPEIWSQGLPDVAALNGHADSAVFQAIERVGAGQGKVISMAITGTSGAGKSHLIHRIRHRLQVEGSGLFVYVNANHFNEVNLMRHEFQQILVDSLRRSGSYGVLQCQQLGTDLVNGAIKGLTPEAKGFAPLELVRKLAVSSQSKNQVWVNQVTEALFKTQPDISDPDIARAIVWTLCNAQTPFAIKWLAGKVLAPWKADDLGLPNHSREDRESVAWETGLQILHLISKYYPLVICFDDFDLGETPDNTLKRERVVASLVRRLLDTLPLVNLDYGIVILTAMTPATWKEKIQTLPPALVTGISGKEDPIELCDTVGDWIVDLVTCWLQNFYADRRLTPPAPIYPFDAGQLRALGREKLTVRQVLEWCAQNFRRAELDPQEKVERAFEGAMAVELGERYWDNSLLAGALCFGFQTLVGQTVEGVKVEAVAGEVKPKSANHDYINFKVIVTQNGEVVKIGVAVLQDERRQSVTAGLKRLTKYETFDLTGGCLVRDADKAIPAGWEAWGYLHRLVAELGGKWVELKAEDIKPLVAIWSVYQDWAEQKLSEAEIFEFIAQRRLTVDNALIRGILRGWGGELAAGGKAVGNAGSAGELADTAEMAGARDFLPDLM